MKLRIPDPEIIRENPFLNDKLDRKQSAIVLTQLFSNITGPFVMALNSTWGTGKTTFIKMFRQHLLNQGFPSIYFNVWETDYQDNLLIAFVGEIHSGINELHAQGFETENAVKVYKKIKKSVKDILKKSVPVAVKTAAHKTLDIEKGIDDAYHDFTSSILENQIKNYAAVKEHVKKFKEHLKELAFELQKHSSEHRSKSRPLIIFIDELERCRPDSAVRVLEKIKHYFDVDGIITVLGMDMEQIGLSVKTVFGQNMKEKSYLRKYFDLEYNLTADNNTIELYCNYLSTETAVSLLLKKHTDYVNLTAELKYSSVLMAASFSMSLSDLKVLFNSIYLIFLTCQNLKKETVALSVILISLKMRNFKLFSQIINKERTVFFVINELNKMKKQNTALKEYDKFFIERRLAALCLKKIPDTEYQQQLQPGSVPGNNELNSIFKMIKDKNNSSESDLFTETLFKKIRLLDSFRFPEDGH